LVGLGNLVVGFAAAVEIRRGKERKIVMGNNFHIGWCPFCNQGWVDIVKDSVNNELFLLCNECDTTWSSPIDVKLDKPANIEPINKIEIPSLTEIQEIGWDKCLVSINNLL